MDQSVLYDQKDNIAIITLNRPEAYNTVTRDLCDGVAAGLIRAENDDSVHLIVITGTGDKAFCAGLDLKILSQDPVALRDDREFLDAFLGRKKPLIGAINGFAITAGFEIALMCDLLYASENAVFSDTHCKVGILPGWGLSQRLSRLIGPARAKELHYTGKKISAHRALEWGLVNKVVSPESLMDETLALAKDVASHDPKHIQAIKSVVDRGALLPLDQAIDYEYQNSREHNMKLDFSVMTERLQQMRKK